jgi:ABC-type multidrug transport system ATPase subunit
VKISLKKAGKKFYHEWIFRNLDIEITSPGSLAVLGPNGSGKSTFLQLISGSMLPTEGSVNYSTEDSTIEGEEIFRHVSYASPYLELIEEFSMEEIIRFHFQFKKTVHGMSMDEIVSITGLEQARKKTFKYFSSGMKQRVKLTLALLTDVEIILLDEPCSNLDREAMTWYNSLVELYSKNKIILVCSNNQTEEFGFCKRQINLMDWKQKTNTSTFIER